MTLKLAIAGAAGRMGRELARLVHATDGCTLAGGLEAKGSPQVGADYGELIGAGKLGIAISDDPAAVLAGVDGIIDFTIPKATLSLVALTAAQKKIHVIGTTGIDAAGDDLIRAAAAKTTIVKTGNFSLGVNLLAALVKKAAATLGEDFDIEVLEMHHRMKIDAPSGTALLLGKAAADGREISLKDRSVRVRDGHTGARNAGDIGFATLRGGSVVGDHTVIFAGNGERLELRHVAESRELFARGAVKAALWAGGKPPGLYSMMDVLGLN
ncbi:4-hydroxy-tetrahydrodipicolinate reductase [Aestuariivirga sp.]|uniref:4-hydroxy-tetrahydrodipicolinate reductase n=1 Tax=Aestuariivirga sp. TaxID=2650926 RepID=UPI0039E4A74E